MKFLPITECPFYLITKASLSITSVLKRTLTQNGLPEVKPAYLGVLMSLWSKEGMDEMLSKLGGENGVNLTELGRRAGLEPSTMTGLIDRMERDGLVSRSNDPNDRRAQQINLTEKGMTIHTRVFAAVDPMLEEAFAGIAPDDMEAAKKVLRNVLTNANKGRS